MNGGSPEIGLRIDAAAGIAAYYHDPGSGRPLLMIHGSAPGVTGSANWRLNMGELAQRGRVLV